MYRLKRVCLKLADLSGRRIMILLLAMALITAGTIGGTAAFLMNSQRAENTFTHGDIQIMLDETDTLLDDDGDPNTNLYEMDVDAVIAKDPRVTVLAGSMDCWLFIRMDESANFDTFLTYTVAEGWTALDGTDNVYYRKVESTNADQMFKVLEGDQVLVKTGVTLAMMAPLTEADYPTLTFTAYAVQRDDHVTEAATPADAWALLNGNANAVQ